MKKRIFIAINLPENVKEKLLGYQSKWPEIPARWAKKDNIHITLVFLGYLSDEELLEVCRVTKEAALRVQPFLITLNKICYGPPKKPARMVWAEGERSEELGKLQKELENALAGGALSNFRPENRAYIPHITLARIRQWEFRQVEPEERPEIDEDISLSFEVKSIEVMESQLKRGGAEYIILKSVPLGQL